MVDVGLVEGEHPGRSGGHGRRTRSDAACQRSRPRLETVPVGSRGDPSVPWCANRTTTPSDAFVGASSRVPDPEVPCRSPICPRLLRDDPALLEVLGRRQATLAVPEPARALVVAGLATVTSRRPILVAVPTTTDADHLTRDLVTFLGRAGGRALPGLGDAAVRADEPRCRDDGSPAAHRCGGCATRSTPRRSWSLRCGRSCSASVPTSRTSSRSSCGAVPSFDPLELVERLVAMGYRREYQAEHRGELAVRGSIVDVFPSTADAPAAPRLLGRRARSAHRVLGRRPALDGRRRGRGASSPAGSCCRPPTCGPGPRS